MTYTTFRTLYTNAVECTNLSDYIHQNTKAMEDEFGDETKLLLKAIWELSDSFTLSTLVRVCGTTSAALSATYGIHPNTISQWKRGIREPTEYLLGLISADALTQKFAQNPENVAKPY